MYLDSGSVMSAFIFLLMIILAIWGLFWLYTNLNVAFLQLFQKANRTKN